jgi:hypothetical protein
MRGMNLPPLPRPPSDVEDCWTLYLSRLERGMPFPAASLLLVAYMAWPNNEAERNGWMATSTASFAARQVESTRAESPTKQVTFELFGGFRVIADSSFSYMMEKLTAVQQRWSRVADVLQAVIDIKHEMRRPIRGGASISKAYDLLKGYPALPRKSQLSKDWSDFRDVAHLIAAAAAIASRGRDRAEGASAVLTAVMLVPEVVLALALHIKDLVSHLGLMGAASQYFRLKRCGACLMSRMPPYYRC